MQHKTMSETGESHDLDLPLLSNVEDVSVYHYVLDLLCDFNQKQFIGSITLFCKPANNLTDKSLHGDNVLSSDHSDMERNYLEKTVVLAPVKNTTPASEQLDFNSKTNNSRHSSIVGCVLSHRLELDDCDKPETIHTASDSSACLSSTHSTKAKENTDADNDIGWNSQTSVHVSDFGEICEKCGVLEAEHVTCTMTNSHVCSSLINMERQEPDVETGVQGIHRTNSRLFNHRHKQFRMVLDSWDIDVESVEEIKSVNSKFLDSAAVSCDSKFQEYIQHSKMDGEPLEFITDKNSIRIWKETQTFNEFPNVIRINYKTHPKGHSLKWTNDQDGRVCVFTHGHWINNRSLFPSQDVPVAMATWQACIHVPCGAVVLMSGDDNPSISHIDEESCVYSYHTHMAMPSSTVALAVGYWTQVDIVARPSHDLHQHSVLPCRLFTPSIYRDLAADKLCEYMPRCMTEAAKLLGNHPFKRLDILVVPSSFCSLGMASPSVMFISQSVLTNGMSVRLAHELSHSWFGLLIGPKDWTEEWLSEGFCTYLEARIHGVVMGWSHECKKNETQIRDMLAFQTLKAELLSNNHDNQASLQTLRPNKVESEQDVNATKYVVNGMNPDKHFMQVHYIKGYFLLKYLCEFVGETAFHDFLKSFVMRYSGKLILSQDFLGMFFESFPALKEIGVTVDGIYKDWLDSPGLPEVLKDQQILDSGNTLAEPVYCLILEIKDFSDKYNTLHWRKRQKLDLESNIQFAKFCDTQMLLFLDELLHIEKIHKDLLAAVNKYYDFDPCSRASDSFGDHNADVQHKWCELIVKHRHREMYSTVRYFLVNHQAMGVYLFGELIVSRDREQRRLAERCFREISADMEEGVYNTVHMMIYGH